MSKPTHLVIGAALAALAVTCAAAPALAITLSPQEAEQVTGISVSGEGTAYEPNKLLISIPNGTRLDELNDILHTCESVAHDPIPSNALVTCRIENGVIYDDNGLDPVIELSLVPGMSVPQAAEELSRADLVVSAEPNVYYELEGQEDTDGARALREELGANALAPQATSTNDPLTTAWAHTAVRLNEAWDLTRCDGSGGADVADKSVAVAVLDSSVRPDHEDLKDRIVYEYDTHSEQESVSDPINNGHGTHVSGIAAGTANNGKGIAGASYNANLVAFKLADDKGAKMNDAMITKALNKILTIRKEKNIRVINLSAGRAVNENNNWGSTLYQRITAVRNAGVLMVASAGNKAPEGYTIPYHHSPSDFDGCLSVINLTQDGSYYKRSSSSNHNTPNARDYANQSKDISAPGTTIKSCISTSASAYENKSGTSMASPLVAGIAALCFAEDPTLTPDQVQNLIQNTANTEKVRQTGWSEEYGHGMVDAYAAVSHIMNNVTVADIADQDFLGTPVEPALALTRHDGTPLVEGTDYTVSFKDNDKLGTATATITGIGDYVGTTSYQFQLTHEAIADTTATYDGKPHTIQVVSDADTLRYSSDGGQTFTLTEPPTITNSGSREVVCQASRDDAIIGTFRATVTVTDAPLTIRLVAADKTYDGTTSDPGARIEVEGTIPGETPAFETNASFADKNVGEHAVNAGAVKAQDGNPYNANYAVRTSYLAATARIHPRPITLTSASASKSYDGKPLTAQRVDVGGSGWGAGDGATYRFAGSQTAVGSSANTFTYAITPASSAGNYTVTTATGTLTVTPAQQASMYRLYNPNSGEHFYTASRGERDALVQVGWTYEGHGWNAPKSGNPVYRLYNANAGDHHYTVSRTERDALVAVGWTYEGVGWNSGGTRPLWRQYNPNAVAGSHNYTPSASERQALVALGWRDEGVAWYGL